MGFSLRQNLPIGDIKNMIHTDKFTFNTISTALLDCYSLDVGDIEKDTGFSHDVFEQLEKKYSGEIYNIDFQDIPTILKGLEWLLITKDESTLADINRNQALNLIKLLSKVKDEGTISSHQWFFGPKSFDVG